MIRGRIGRIAKAVVAAVGGLATALTPVVADEVIGLDELGTVVSAIVVAVGTVAAVWRVPNRSSTDG
ncbi:hypothetical protein FHU38_000979 [Saccharomonospora amisosensis]|uniref:Uncharacterized protein n=1 Tax=Saccharomonospora amisosensis TaxID=1128677 RepID=A0A7X5UMC5_9PSEU|nr:hypothetical protein [Saccharomonospora amisosensis]NIJ10635.1 hypothetical protein [Saccharomonospora amisosensis]